MLDASIVNVPNVTVHSNKLLEKYDLASTRNTILYCGSNTRNIRLVVHIRDRLKRHRFRLTVDEQYKSMRIDTNDDSFPICNGRCLISRYYVTASNLEVNSVINSRVPIIAPPEPTRRRG